MKTGRGPTLLLRALVPGTVLALASCASLPDVRVPKEVRVPVPTACIDPAQRPQRPATTPDADLMAMDRGTRTLRAWADRERLQGYVAELEAAVEGCSRIPVPPPR